MDTFDDLMRAMDRYFAEKAEYDKAAATSRNHYFLHDEREARDRAKERFREALNNHILAVAAKKMDA